MSDAKGGQAGAKPRPVDTLYITYDHIYKSPTVGAYYIALNCNVLQYYIAYMYKL
jgi:hypothetical protein